MDKESESRIQSNDGETPVIQSAEQNDIEKPEPDIFDPFSAENIKYPQDLLDQAMTTALLTAVPVGRPSSQVFVQVHPSEDYHFLAPLIAHEDEQSARYLIHPTYLPKIVGSTNIKFHVEKLYLYTTRQGGLGLWPIKLPKDQRENTWLESQMGAIEAAMENWVCVTTNQSRRMYIAEKARGMFPPPDWDAILQGRTMYQILATAFKDRLILSEEHPLIQKLLGMV